MRRAKFMSCFLVGWDRRRYLLSTCRMARKASCGISTVPTCFMRFLPAFCFSFPALFPPNHLSRPVTPPAVALRQHLLTQCFDVLPRDGVRPARALHRHIEHLPRDQLAHFFYELASSRLGARAVYDQRKGI